MTGKIRVPIENPPGSSSQWGELLFELYDAPAMQRQLNREISFLLELERSLPPLPPRPWHVRARRRISWWLEENVWWRFARRRPEYDD